MSIFGYLQDTAFFQSVLQTKSQNEMSENIFLYQIMRLKITLN